MLEDTNDLLQQLRTTPIPTGVKARIAITGLCICHLSTANSTIRFLRHLGDHELVMYVLRRTGPTGTPTTTGPTTIGPAQGVSVTVDGSASPAKIKDASFTALEKMVNFRDLHGGTLISKPVTPRPSNLVIQDCAFFTMRYFETGCFDLIEGSIMGTGMPREIGYVMGGHIRADPNSTVTIVFTNPSGGPGTFPGPNQFYDIIFDNRCTNSTACRAVAAPIGGTDFARYYEALQDSSSATRIFFLRKLIEDCTGVGLFAPEDEPFRTADVAACNPGIIEPPPTGY